MYHLDNIEETTFQCLGYIHPKVVVPVSALRPQSTRAYAQVSFVCPSQCQSSIGLLYFAQFTSQDENFLSAFNVASATVISLIPKNNKTSQGVRNAPRSTPIATRETLIIIALDSFFLPLLLANGLVAYIMLSIC